MTNETALREAARRAANLTVPEDHNVRGPWTRKSLWYVARDAALAALEDHRDEALQPPQADVDRIVRTLYEARPFTVISQALSDATGLPMGDPIPWEAFIASGGDPSGLRWHVEQTLAALSAHPQASPPPVQGEPAFSQIPPENVSNGQPANEKVSSVQSERVTLERWPGYAEQSWSERFAELDRRHSKLHDRMQAAFIAALAHSQPDTQEHIDDAGKKVAQTETQEGE